ncbi:hypothetical protein BJY01DRAFT_254742 [Aspergillus pseudoustus]|uniref:GH16 domain-containing protein n=1 Tax=Aspergillus pseudoustus TaxID=1810923 RepID=A0ABR4IQV1_9EURO
MPRPSLHTAELLSVLISAPAVLEQTYTDCNPLNTSCLSNTGTTESTLYYDFTQDSTLYQWETLTGTAQVGSEGIELTINEQGDAPTIAAPFYIFFGEVPVTMKASPGTGIISSIVLQSDDLDEVDWEDLGSYTTQLQTDSFGKGDSSGYDRLTWEPIDNPHNIFPEVNWALPAGHHKTSIRNQTLRYKSQNLIFPDSMKSLSSQIFDSTAIPPCGSKGSYFLTSVNIRRVV